MARFELVRDVLPSGISLRDLGDHRLKDLTRPEHIFQVVISTLPADFPSLRTLDHHRHNLPMQPTPLIGREREVAAVCALLRRADIRLVTLTGFGGIGKTRLGLQAAAELLDDVADGVFFVSLAPVSSADMVLPTIAQALDVRESEGRALRVCLHDYVRDKQMLLVLDNFEHVLAAADLVAELLTTAPRLKMLVTSRATLHLSGEQEYVVPALSLPQPDLLPALERMSQYEAVALFIARAQAAKADFAVTNANAPAVAQICQRLDGLPLAIELAARIKLFTPQELLARLNNRLALLTSGARDMPARQQTLRKTIDWSYGLLKPHQQQLFRHFAVFAGGCTLVAAEEVCRSDDDASAVLDIVAALLDQSLLGQVEMPSGESRFVMLE
ncbi:MAG: NB-ARC domain-containing protein, partial [Chloroflexota bacterium]|nr:NB-ARC domain-containing protein [Chloroflexota bacterium]